VEPTCSIVASAGSTMSSSALARANRSSQVGVQSNTSTRGDSISMINNDIYSHATVTAQFYASRRGWAVDAKHCLHRCKRAHADRIDELALFPRPDS